MRKFFRLLAFSVFMLCGIMARADNITIIWVNSAPSGSCTNGQPMQYVISTGVLYSCQAGTWGSFGTGSGAVTAVSVATANGVSGTSSGGSTPALTIALGAITPTSTNGVTAATMAYMDATSSVQTQLNARLPLAGGTMTGALNAPEIESTLYADQYSGSDIGAKTNAAIAASSLAVPSVVVIPPGTYNIMTPIVIDRPVTLIGTGAILKPTSGGASGTWGKAPVTLSSRTLTIGTTTFTVANCTGITPGAYTNPNVEIAIGGPGLPPDDYIASCSSTTATLALAPAISILGIPTQGSNQLCVPSTLGLQSGQTLNGLGVSALNISSIAAATNCITMSGNATASAANPQAYTVTGSVSTTLTAQAVVPVVNFVYNASALLNASTQMIGAGVKDLWLQDPAGVAGNSITGVQGIKINGYDNFANSGIQCQGLAGSCLVVAGYSGPYPASNLGFPVRESDFDNVLAYSSGNWASGQSEVLIANPTSSGTATDEVNQIGFKSPHFIYPDGIALNLASYASGVTSRLIYINGPDAQIEKGNVQTGVANLAGPGPLVNLQSVDDIYFDDTELNGAGYAAPLVNLVSFGNATFDHSRLRPQGGNATYTVSLTNGSATVGLKAGYTYAFDATGKWNGVGVWLVDGTTCTNGAPCLYFVTSVGSATSLTLASNYGGTTNVTNATLTFVSSGPYFNRLSAPFGSLTAIGDEWNDPFNTTSPNTTVLKPFGLTFGVIASNVLLTGVSWASTNYDIRQYDGSDYVNKTIVSNQANISSSNQVAAANQIGTPLSGLGSYSNLLTNSQFDSSSLGAAWQYYCATPTDTANSTDFTDPIGTYTSLKVVTGALGCSGTAAGFYQVLSPTLTVGVPYTVSVWLKGASGGEKVMLGLDDGYEVPIGPLTTSWQRYTVTQTLGGSSSRGFEIYATTASTFYMWGAQAVQAVLPGVYAHSVASAVSSSGLAYSGADALITPCGISLSNAGSAIPAATYTTPLSGKCKNGWNTSYTITRIECYSDNSGSSTGNVSDSNSNALLTGAITASPSWVAGTQSAYTTISPGVWTNWTVVADGTSKVINCTLWLAR